MIGQVSANIKHEIKKEKGANLNPISSWLSLGHFWVILFMLHHIA